MSEKTPWDFLEEYRGKAFKGEWPTLKELFEITTLRYPDRPCFTSYEPDRVSLNYSQALAHIRAIAAYLVSTGVLRGDKVALTGKNSPEWAIAYFAILFAGATVVPIDYQLRREETDNLIRASDSRVIFVDEEKYDEIDLGALGLKEKFSLSKGKPKYLYSLTADTSTHRLPESAPDDCMGLAAILFTSGTTGIPKGVMLSHKNFVSDCFLAQYNLHIFHTDVFYALLPIHHSYTMLAVFIEAVSVGAEIVFGKKMVTSVILKDLREAKITMFLGVPMLFNKVLAGILRGVREKGVLVYGLIRFLMAVSGIIKKVFRVNPGKKLFGTVLKKASLNTNRICISGGGPLAPEIFKKYNQLGIDFIQGYGLTETSPILTLNPKEKYKVASVGRVLPQMEMKVLDPDERGIGELIVKGPMVMKGYYKNEAATREVFTEDGWFRTGDVGYLDSDQYLYLTGRAKSLIVTEGGKNVYPEEIENEFQLFEEVEQVLVRGYIVDKKLKSEGIEALVFPSSDFFKDKNRDEVEDRIEEIISDVNEELLPYQRIIKLTVLTERMEETTTKKIKRHKL